MLQILLICTLSVTVEVFGELNKNPLIVFIKSHKYNDVPNYQDYNNVIDSHNDKQLLNEAIKLIMTKFFNQNKTQNLRTCEHAYHGRQDLTDDQEKDLDQNEEEEKNYIDVDDKQNDLDVKEDDKKKDLDENEKDDITKKDQDEKDDKKEVFSENKEEEKKKDTVSNKEKKNKDPVCKPVNRKKKRKILPYWVNPKGILKNVDVNGNDEAQCM